MLLHLGAGVLDARGSIAAETFARNRYGHYARERVTPTDPATALQLARRNDITIAARQWTTSLTAAQRDKWRAYAAAITRTNRFGEPTHLTGYHEWVRYRAFRRHTGLGYSRTPPPDLHIPPGDPSLAATLTAPTTISIVFDDSAPWCSNLASAMVLFGTPGFGPGVTFIGGPYHLIGLIYGNPTNPPTSPYTALTYPFTLTAGQHARIRARITFGDGGLTNLFYTEAVVNP